MIIEPIDDDENPREGPQPPRRVISSSPVVPAPKKTRTRGDLPQMRTDVRQVAFIDMVNAFKMAS